MQEYGDVPFGVNSPTALLRRRQWSITFIWLTFVLTSLPIHLFLNGVSGFSIQAYPVNGRVTSDPNNVFDYEKSWQPGAIEIVQCAQILASAENWVNEFRNLTIVVRSKDDVPKYQGFVDSWNTGVREDQGPPTANDLVTCYMDQLIPQCTVTLRWFPLVMTTLALVIKSITAFVAIRKCDHFKHRLYNSLGDFIAVATRHRDVLSVPGECLASSGDYRRPEVRALKGGGIPMRAAFERRYWLLYLGFLDWIVWTFWIVSIILVWVLMGKSVDTVRADYRDENGGEISDIFELFSIAGFGKASLAFILGNSIGQSAFDGQSAAGLPLQIAIANAPQLWLSIGYLFWNNQITRIWSEHEWRSYAGRRKPPRVSYGASEPGIRNARWLQLPYSLSILLMIISTTMHWVVSQALFVVEVENFSLLPKVNGQAAPFGIIFAICYSPTAIFVIALLALLLLLGLSIYYLIPFRSWMPFMAGSARVVFASCTALPKDLPADGIMWGDISDEWGRVAGFGEHARGLQVGKIYPERFKRAVNPASDAASVISSPVPSARSFTSETPEPIRQRNPGTLSRQSTTDTIRTALPPYEPNPPPMPVIPQYARPVSAASSVQSRGPQVEPLTIPTSASSLRYPSPPPTTSPLLTPDSASRTGGSGHISQYGTGYRSSSRNERFALHDQSRDQINTNSSAQGGWGSNQGTSHVERNEPQEWRGWGINPEE